MSGRSQGDGTVVYEPLEAGDVAVDAAAFSGNLGSGDVDVQAALATIDALSLGGGGTPYTLPQATEATRGGVQGATAVQAIAASGTTILAWSNNRLRQIIAVVLPTATAAQAIAATGTGRVVWTVTRLRALVTAALPTMVQTDIDNSTTGRKAVTGALIAANAGGDAASVDGFSIQSVTQAEYDALTPDPNTLYFIA